jgi:hypothetical protein
VTPEQFNGLVLAAGLVLGAIYAAVCAFEARRFLWKAGGFAALAVALAVAAWIVGTVK